jgi:hypothetical protein
LEAKALEALGRAASFAAAALLLALAAYTGALLLAKFGQYAIALSALGFLLRAFFQAFSRKGGQQAAAARRAAAKEREESLLRRLAAEHANGIASGICAPLEPDVDLNDPRF